MSNKIKVRIQPTPKQELVWEAWFDDALRFVGFGGGAGGGKSWGFCEIFLFLCYRYPGIKLFIARKELKRLMSSTYLTFVKVCAHHKIPQEDWKLNGQYNYIEFNNGSRIDLLDVAPQPSDQDYERFGSLEYTQGWFEEAGEVAFKAFDVLKSRVGRHKNNEYNLKPKIGLTFNPSQGWLYTALYKPWKTGQLPSDWKFIQALYSDNPYTAQEYGQQLDSIKSESVRLRLRDGAWEYDADPAILIKLDSATDIFTNTVEPSEDKYLTIDAARFGGDLIPMIAWKGFHAYKYKVFSRQGIDKTIDEVRTFAAEEKIPWSRIIIDETGLGAGIVDLMPGTKGFVGSASPIQLSSKGIRKIVRPQEYLNLRAQCFYALADKINEHGICTSIAEPSIRDTIVSELRTIRAKNPDTDGKLGIISKEEMKEFLGHSPDWADCLSMRMWFDIREPVTTKLVEKPKTIAEIELINFRKSSNVPFHTRL